MHEIIHMSKNPVTSGPSIMYLVTRPPIVTIVNELACVLIKMIRPILILPTCIQHDEFLIFTSPRGPEPATVPDAIEKLWHRLIAAWPC